MLQPSFKLLELSEEERHHRAAQAFALAQAFCREIYLPTEATYGERALFFYDQAIEQCRIRPMLIRCVNRDQPSPRFLTLRADGNLHLTAEAFIVRHPEHFRPEIVEICQLRLASA